jgi:hypothetical protein
VFLDGRREKFQRARTTHEPFRITMVINVLAEAIGDNDRLNRTIDSLSKCNEQLHPKIPRVVIISQEHS